MLIPIYSNAFKKDIKLAQKRQLNMSTLRALMLDIANETPLAARHRNHKLTGNWKAHWECHVSPDWLLIYKVEADTVTFERTGSHADLF
jgi:mRNA interferase YafQ